MAKNLTEDAVRDLARNILGLADSDAARAGVGQLTTFNQLGFAGVADKPDGWYLPKNKADVALVLETKATRIALGKAQVDEVLKNVRIVQTQYEKVVGVLYNGEDVRVFKGEEEVKTPDKLQHVGYYLSLYTVDSIDKERIYQLTARINNCLHFEFGIKNLYHRMIFTACALVAERYGAGLKRLKNLGYATFHTAIHSTLSKSLEDSRKQNAKIDILLEEYSDIKMNPPYENKYGCMTIVENVLDSVPTHTQCAFILPDKKLEKASKTQMKRILKNHRLRKVIKLPEDLFFGVGVTTSIFVFEAGVAQDSKEFFACYMESDGLVTVKNKGRHDVYGKWAAIEAYWVDVVEKQSGDDTCQWVNPTEHLSYQMPQKPFEIFEEDFRKTAMDYLMFQQGIDAKVFGEKLLDTAMYSSRVSADDESVTLTMRKGGEANGED